MKAYVVTHRVFFKLQELRDVHVLGAYTTLEKALQALDDIEKRLQTDPEVTVTRKAPAVLSYQRLQTPGGCYALEPTTLD